MQRYILFFNKQGIFRLFFQEKMLLEFQHFKDSPQPGMSDTFPQFAALMKMMKMRYLKQFSVFPGLYA